MAKKIHWQIKFTNFKNEAMSVSIYQEGYAGEIVHLTPSAHPFSTNENNDTDAMKPVRTSTGYFRVINKGNLDGLMPKNDTEHYVELRLGLPNSANSTVLWCGYMTAETFGRDMYVEGEEAEFAVADILETLKSVPIEKPETFGMKAFGTFISDALMKINGDTSKPIAMLEEDANIYIPDEVHKAGSTNCMSWLNIKVSDYNFFTKNDGENTGDADYQQYERDSYYEVIEQIMSMMGFTMMQRGKDLWILSALCDRYAYQNTVKLLTDVKLGQVPTVKGYVDVQIAELGNLKHTTTDNQYTDIPGYRYVKVTVSPNAVDDLGGEVSTNGLKYVRLKEYTAEQIGDKIRSLIFDNRQQDLLLHQYKAMPSSEGAPAVMEEKEYSANVDDYGSRVVSQGNQSGYIITQICRADRFKPSEITDGTKKSYNYQDTILINYRYPFYEWATGNNQWEAWFYKFPAIDVIRLNAGRVPSLNDGCLIVNFSLAGAGYSENAPEDYKTFNVKVSLKVGNRYWNGSAWTTVASTFNIPVKDRAIVNNKTIEMDYEDAESGFIVPVNTPISGEVEFKLIADESWLQNSINNGEYGEQIGFDGTYMTLSNLSISYRNPVTVSVKESRSQLTYSATKENGFSESKGISQTMATRAGELKNGYGILNYGNRLLMAGDFMGYGKGTLEEIVLEKMRRLFLRQTRQAVVTVEIPNSSQAIKNGARVKWNEKPYRLISQSIDWWDAEARLQLQSIEDLKSDQPSGGGGGSIETNLHTEQDVFNAVSQAAKALWSRSDTSFPEFERDTFADWLATAGVTSNCDGTETNMLIAKIESQYPEAVGAFTKMSRKEDEIGGYTFVYELCSHLGIMYN